jgi:hypothetical protein
LHFFPSRFSISDKSRQAEGLRRKGTYMRSYLAAAAVVAVLLGAGYVDGAEAPLSVAGFTLGRPIEEFADRLYPQTAMPIRYMESMQEAEIKPVPGLKSGFVTYGTCRKPESILRIKLKYADGSVEFFEELLKRIKSRFGDPGEYQGDPFRVFISWKWSFTDRHKNRISLTLQHNELDEDEKIGNAIKLTLLNQLEEESRCFEQKLAENGPGPRKHRVQDLPTGTPRWDLFIPK